jgi:4-hydroxymandelate oxidase
MELINLFDYEAAAKAALPAHVWDFIEAGQMDEVTKRRNRSAFEAIALRPRYLRNVEERELSTTVLGTTISLPVMISPAGMHSWVHPDGELATARGAGAAGTLLMVSNASAFEGQPNSPETIATAATGPLWYQIYHQNRQLTQDLAGRVEAAGYRALCFTVDAPIMAPKERDRRNRDGLRQMPGYVDMISNGGVFGRPFVTLTWADLAWVRSMTKLPIMLKGINTAEDAALAVENGVDGILVSTHGGRNMDGTISSIEALPEVVAAAAGKAEVFLDSGIRRGSDVVKALALGARAVSFGRPLFWGLAVGGADGVRGVLDVLRAEIDVVLAYCGQSSVSSIEPNVVSLPPLWGGRLGYL